MGHARFLPILLVFGFRNLLRHPLHDSFRQGHSARVLIRSNRLRRAGVSSLNRVIRKGGGLKNAFWYNDAVLLKERDQFTQIVRKWKTNAPRNQQGFQRFL